MRKIYTYTDLATLNECSFFEELRNLPQITVTSDLRKGLNGDRWNQDKQYKKYQIIRFDRPAHDIGEVLRKISPDWASESTKFQQTVYLSQYLREQIKKTDDAEELKWLQGCRRNIPSLLSSIILLVEAYVRPEDIPINDRNINLLVNAWKYLEKMDNSIQKLYADIDKLNESGKRAELFKELFGTPDSSKIILHGFYFITPLQQKLFSLLEDNRCELIFLFSYDEKYPFVNEIWDSTYTTYDGYPAKKEWIMEKHMKDIPIAEIFEGNNNISFDNKIRIWKYPSTIDFVLDMRRVIDFESFSVYTSNYNTANQILRDFYPEKYGDRRLLSYPIGQFVYALNQMWDEETDSIILDEDMLRQCFASGWLSADDKSSKSYMQDLEYVLPFFAGCKTTDDWNNRLSKLEEICNYAVEPFRVRRNDTETSDSRWESVYNNPFDNFSMFSVEPDRLDMVIALITQLIEMAKSLFGSGQIISLGEHMLRLKHILEKHDHTDILYAEEHKIIEKLFVELEKPDSTATKCFPSDIASALALYLRGNFEDEERRANNVGMIYPMYQVDAASIKNSSKVHICLCDVNNMPGSKRDYIWPLSQRLIEEIQHKTHNGLLLKLKHVMDSATICNRYFIYSALKNNNVELSWIDNMNDKSLAPSPYIKVLNAIGNIKIQKPFEPNLALESIAAHSTASPRIEEYKHLNTNRYVAVDATMDYSICPMKYVMGYVLEKHPTYQTTFLQNYAVNGFISAVYNLFKDEDMDLDTIQKNVIGLFPNLRSTEKQQIIDYLNTYSSDIELGQTTEYEDFAYTDERLKIKYPNQEVREAIGKKYAELLTPQGTKGINAYDKCSTKMVCAFCQHADYCRNAVFHLDQEETYD